MAMSINFAGTLSLDGIQTGGASFVPSDNENVIGWFELASAADQTLDGTDVTAVANRVAGSVTLSNSTGLRRPSTGGSLNGVPALTFENSDYLAIENLPTTGTINFFVGMRSNPGADASITVIGNETGLDTYLPIGQAAGTSTNNVRYRNANDPVGLVTLFDSDGSQQVVNRGDFFTAMETKSLVAFVGISVGPDAHDLGRGPGAYDFIGDMTRLVVVEGAMSAGDIAAMQAYFQSSDNWP